MVETGAEKEQSNNLTNPLLSCVVAFFDGVRLAHVLTLLGLTIVPGTGLMVDVRIGVNPYLTVAGSTGVSRSLGLVGNWRRSRAGRFLVEETKPSRGGGRRGSWGNGLLAGTGVVIGEAAAVASFRDLFFGVALAAGVALATGAAGLGAGLAALCDLFFGVAEAAGVGVVVCEYASGEAAIANRARSERNLRIQLFYLDFTPLGNPGSERKRDF